MKINPITGPDGFIYEDVDISLTASPIFKGSEVQYAVILSIIPFRYDENGNIIPNYNMSITDAIPDIRNANMNQLLVISTIESAIKTYILNKYGEL